MAHRGAGRGHLTMAVAALLSLAAKLTQMDQRLRIYTQLTLEYFADGPIVPAAYRATTDIGDPKTREIYRRRHLEPAGEAMSRKATVSLVSYCPVPGDDPQRLATTLDKMTGHVGQAAALGSDLVVFPEICAYLGAPEAWVFEDLDGPTVTAMRSAARERSIYAIIPQATMEHGRRRNSAVLIDRTGEITGIYHKNVPTHGELDIGIVPGTETPVFDTDFGRVGMCICFDLNYWEVGSGLRENRPELVIWPSMWMGVRMMSRWAIEFGYHMAGVYSGGGAFIDAAGRPVTSAMRVTSDETGVAPLVTAELELDTRVVHHDYNVPRLKPLFEKYGAAAATAEHLGDECLLVLCSQMADKSTDELIAEFGIETTREYAARARRDRQRALDGAYPVTA